MLIQAPVSIEDDTEEEDGVGDMSEDFNDDNEGESQSRDANKWEAKHKFLGSNEQAQITKLVSILFTIYLMNNFNLM